MFDPSSSPSASHFALLSLQWWSNPTKTEELRGFWPKPLYCPPASPGRDVLYSPLFLQSFGLPRFGTLDMKALRANNLAAAGFRPGSEMQSAVECNRCRTLLRTTGWPRTATQRNAGSSSASLGLISSPRCEMRRKPAPKALHRDVTNLGRLHGA